MLARSKENVPANSGKNPDLMSLKAIEVLGRKETVHDLWVTLAITRDAIIRSADKELRKYGITHSQASVMVWINALGKKATPANIAHHLFRQHHSISEQLIRMEQAGLIVQIRDFRKKTLKRYELTEKGRKKYLKAEQGKIIEGIFSPLSGTQRQQLRSLLVVLFTEAMKNLKIEDPPPIDVD